MRGATFVLVMGAVASIAAGVEVPLTVREPVGVARKAEPVSTGVCFKPGEVKDPAALSLVTKDGRPVPCQFLPIVTLEDGSVQWALLDFQTDLSANGTAEFVVKDGRPTPPAQPVHASEQAGVFTIENGLLTVVVDTSKPVFEALASVKVGGREVLKGLGAEALTCRDALNQNKLYHAGKPTKVGWDWRGHVRATLMAEGPYVDEAGGEWLGYRVRVSVFAGSKLVRVEHELRNSCPTEVRHVKVKDAYLRLGLASPAPAARSATGFVSAGAVSATHRLLSGYFSPGLHEQAVEGGKLVTALVPVYEGPYDSRNHRGYNAQDKAKDGTPADYNPGDTGSYWLYDCAYKVDEVWLDFGGGGEGQAKALNSRLYALAPASYYSECGALAFGRFGTLDDEARTYALWGWKNIDAKKAALLKNEWMAPRPTYHVAYELIHEESETDDAEGCLLMALRTGGRGYFDAGLAWARYYTNNFIPRTDFPFGTSRGRGQPMKFVGKDVSIMQYDESYGNGRTCGCHFYGAGAMDYYVLTGEKSMLLGAVDLAEYAKGNYGDVPKNVIGKTGVSSWGSRAFGRQFMALVRIYEITRDPAWKKTMDFAAELALSDPCYLKEDDYGFLHSPGSNSVEKANVTRTLQKYERLQKHLQDKGYTWDGNKSTLTDKTGKTWEVYDAAGSWEQTYVQQGLHRYWRLTGDREAAEYVRRFANFFRRFAWDDHCQQVGYRLWGVHFPERGQCLGSQLGRWDPAHDKCPAPGAQHDGWYTRFGPDVAARAFEVTGDATYLEQAKMYWNRGSKRGYHTTTYSAADDEVGAFASHVPPKDDSILSTGLTWYACARPAK